MGSCKTFSLDNVALDILRVLQSLPDATLPSVCHCLIFGFNRIHSSSNGPRVSYLSGVFKAKISGNVHVLVQEDWRDERKPHYWPPLSKYLAIYIKSTQRTLLCFKKILTDAFREKEDITPNGGQRPGAKPSNVP